MRFKIGDRVRIRRVPCESIYKRLLGKETTIRGLSRFPGFWTIDRVVNGRYVDAAEWVLEPIIDLGSWDEITRMIGKDIRKPMEVLA